MIYYLDEKNRLLFVSSGIGKNRFGTFYRKRVDGYGGTHRIKSQTLPMRKTRAQAEDDLAWYAVEHGLAPVTVSHQE